MAKLNKICINGDCSETPSAFAKVNVDGTVLSADSNDDTLNVEAGTNITLTPNIASDTVEISAPNVYNKTEVDDLISGVGGLKWVKDVDGSGQTSLQGVVENDVANNVVTGMYSHAEGEGTTASGLKSHAEGEDTVASGDMSHAEGRNSVASGYNAHAEGSFTKASGGASHAEGYFAKATGQASHAEGYNTKATASNAHAEGILSQATAEEAHAEGEETLASGESSHAEGSNTEASGSTSHAEGMRTKASSRNQHVQGRYNVEDANDVYAHIVGNGTSNANRSNAYALKWTGASTQKAAVEIQDMYIPQTTPAPANGYYGVHNDVAYRIVDSSGNTVGYLTDFFTDSRGRGVQLSVERTVEGEVLNNDLTLGIDDNGEATVEVTDGDAWTGAIGAVKKTGDTMTGNLDMADGALVDGVDVSKLAMQVYNSGAHNLNNFKTRGLYYFMDGCTLTNVPNGAVNGWLTVIDNGIGAFKQYWHRHGSVPTTFKDEYYRYYTGSVWSDWIRIGLYDDIGIIHLGAISISGQLSAVGSWIKSNFIANRWISARVNATESGYFETSGFCINANLSSQGYGWGWLQSDGANMILFFRVSGGTFYWWHPTMTQVTG